MQSFEYANPTTVQEAVALLGAKWGQTDVLAGGTDLISLMKDHLHTPTRVVNIKGIKELEGILWQICERVSRRAKVEHIAGRTITLKLKTREFKIRTRDTTLQEPTLLADRIFSAARPLLRKEATGTAYRLLGVGISHLSRHDLADSAPTLDREMVARAKAELAVDKLRAKFGLAAVERGFAFSKKADTDSHE